MEMMVTGASGHLGHSVVKQLLAAGHTVKAVVRDSAKAEKLQLHGQGLQWVTADLTVPGALNGAMENVEVLYQCAANFNHWSLDPQRDIIEVNNHITRNTLKSAHFAQVKRVIYVSSVGVLKRSATGAVVEPDGWTDATYGNPYFDSKVQSEKLAWQLARELDLAMVAVLPAAMIGGDGQHETPTTQFIRSIYDGKVPFDLECDLNLVDVDDVAAAMVNCAVSGAPGDRYILANAKGVSIQKIAEICRHHNPKAKKPLKVGKSMLLSVAWVAELMGRLTHVEPALLRSQVRIYHQSRENYNILPAIETLGFHPRLAEDAVGKFVRDL